MRIMSTTKMTTRTTMPIDPPTTTYMTGLLLAASSVL